jgi:uncharacterized protein (TIGR02996 family)
VNGDAALVLLRGLTLARALAQLKKNADPLDALLEAWAASPSPEVGDLIFRASAIVQTSPAGLRGKTKSAITAWTELARAPRAADVPALLESLCDVLWRDAQRRLVLMRKWRPDPRVDEALVQALERLPYRSTSKPFYTEVIAQLARIRDPVLVERIQDAEREIARQMSPTLGDWLRRRVRELVAKLEPAKQTEPVDVRALSDLLDQRATATAPRAALEDLLYAIYERPDDTARRLVYADALLERGDARGELITLQCQETLTPQQQRRERALLKANGLAWLGELAPIMTKEYRFERGFLADCRVDSNKGTRILPLVGNPAWSTVHTLRDSAQIALHPIMRSLRTLEFRPNRARQREQYGDAWRELLAGSERPIERLHYTDLDMYSSGDEIGLLGQCSALPKLRELYVGGAACYRSEELYDAPIASRVETLGFMVDRYTDIEPRLFGSDLRASRIRRVVVVHEELTLRLERVDGEIAKARIDVHGRRLRQAVGIIGALPVTIRELRVRTSKETDRGALVALAVAARSLQSLEVREIGPNA